MPPLALIFLGLPASIFVVGSNRDARPEGGAMGTANRPALVMALRQAPAQRHYYVRRLLRQRRLSPAFGHFHPDGRVVSTLTFPRVTATLGRDPADYLPAARSAF